MIKFIANDGYFRAIAKADLNECFVARNDPERLKWFRQNTALNYDNHLEWYEKTIKDPTIEMLIACNNMHTPTAVCGLTSIDRINSRAEISYNELNPNANAVRILTNLVTHAFDNQNLNQVWVEIFEGSPMIPIFERLHFKLDGKLRDYYFRQGKFIDAYRYSMLRGEH